MEAEVKIIEYVGVRLGPGHVVVAVHETENLITKTIHLPVTPSLRHRNHSPDGFEWGYHGSGPAQLALAILLHAAENYYGLEPGNDWAACVCEEIDPADRPCIVCQGRDEFRKEGTSRALLRYQDFKSSVVAKFQGGGFRLPLSTVIGWLTVV
jgi:hypothetical protein